MKDYEQIERSEVWPLIQMGKAVYVAILKSPKYREGVFCLSSWNAYDINCLLRSDNVIFFKDKEDKQ